MCGYNPFFIYDWIEEKEHNEEIEKDVRMLKDLPIKEFTNIVKKLTKSELDIALNIGYKWHDEELIKLLKKELKQRGLAWN